jgi:predicted ATPase/DNA-binding SARP family transcriptional activator/Tfp pilus assembly protein PilF
MAHLSISLLGSFQVTLDGQPVTSFGTDKARALLAYLAVEAHRPHRRDVLAGLLWATSPQPRARQSLRQALSSLRRALGDAGRPVPFLLASRETIQLNPRADVWLDAAECTVLFAASRVHPHRRIDRCLPCMRRMEEIARLYRGKFLGGFFLADSTAFEEWASLQREHLQRQVMEALSHLGGYYERRGDMARAIQVAYRQVQMEPWLEEAHRELMRLLALAGRRSAALAQYRTCQAALADELGVGPTSETTALYQQIKDQEHHRPVPSLSAGPAFQHNLPPAPTAFVGREEEREELANMLAAPCCRLVTLTGPGGIGKTRLALQVADDQVGLSHGVTFVSLADLDSVDLLAPTLASAVGLQLHSQGEPEQQLLDFVREKELLLVLDNMEHLLEGSDLLARILQCAPAAILLVTSRERLNLREEWVYRLDGLACPPGPAPEGMASYGAASLFIQTAQRAHHKFTLSEREAPFVAHICRMVEGMPLAVELAAAWIPVRTCEEIANEIEQNLNILATRLRNVPARHRSLHAALEHSWASLSEPERTALARLSLFRGSFEGQAAQHVTGASSETLAGLVNKSLLRRTASEQYEMHLLVQRYVAERLRAEPREQRTAEELLCDYYGQFLQAQEAWLHGAKQPKALEAMASRIENVRLAWRLALATGNIETLGRLLPSLGAFYAIRCWNREGARVFAQAAERLSAGSFIGDNRGQEAHRNAVILGQLLAWQGHFAHQLGQSQKARALLERSLDTLRPHGVPNETAFALYTLGQILLQGQNDYDGAGRLFRESLALYDAGGDRYGHAQALDGLGDVAARQGEREEARRHYEEGLALRRQIGDLWGISSSLGSLGGLAGRQGAYDEAQRWFQESLAITRDLQNPRGVAACLHNLSTVAYLQEDYVKARRLRQETLDICRQIGYRWGIASALKSLGDVACRLGDPAQAKRYLEESLALLQEAGDRRSQAYTLNSLGTVAQTLGESQQARRYFQQALKAATEIEEPALSLDVLTSVARLVAEGREVERALELLALVWHHPACEQQTRERSEPLRQTLSQQVSAEVARAAEARGRALELDDVAAQILD